MNKIEVNKKYNRLLVLEILPNKKIKCLCDCGKYSSPEKTKVLKNITKSCGCLAREITKTRSIKHNECKSSEYSSWNSMITRCTNPNHKYYNRYGGRGIKVCASWLGENGFSQFLLDMGKKPTKGLCVDRIDNNGNYSPKNCRWGTRKEQARNRNNTKIILFQGKNYKLCELVEKLNLSYQLVHKRLSANWSMEKALDYPNADKVLTLFTKL